MVVVFFFFFFQAEDGIRDGTVTGVQTCALPISEGLEKAASLTATLVRARADTKAGGAAGHELLLRLTSVQTGLLKANAETARVHEGLLRIGREMGYVDELCHYGALPREVQQAA